MHRQGIIPRIWGFLRNYTIPVVLLGVFVQTVVQTYITGIAPVPQQPPLGYVVEENQAKLQWHRGTTQGPWELQVTDDKDPEFTRKVFKLDDKDKTPVRKDPKDGWYVTRSVSGTTHMLSNLEPGKTYYWRLVRGNDSSSTYNFKISEHAIAF